ncbi:MAG: hypothetical protein WCX88_01165 [Patescibacteria group bacterium]
MQNGTYELNGTFFSAHREDKKSGPIKVIGISPFDSRSSIAPPPDFLALGAKKTVDDGKIVFGFINKIPEEAESVYPK